MISIIIPILNAQDMTEDCILSVIENVGEPFEIVLIDNGSTPPYSMGAVHGHGVLIRNETNTGFPFAINQGIRAARGDTIILLNNDCIVTHQWAERLENWLNVYSIVSPVTNYCAGIQRVYLSVYRDQEELNREAVKWGNENSGEGQEVNWVIGFCMAFKKSLWEEIGPFDESLWPCSGEELDFCLKARKAGHKIGIARDVYVHHEGSQTFKDLMEAGQVDYNALCVRNEAHVRARHGNFWNNQRVKEAAE